MAKEWYVLRVASGRESTVRGALLKKIQLADLEEQVPTVLVPTERVSEIKGGKKLIIVQCCRGVSLSHLKLSSRSSVGGSVADPLSL